MRFIANVLNDRYAFSLKVRIYPMRRLTCTLRGGSHAPCEEARIHRATRLACTLRGGSHASCEEGRSPLVIPNAVRGLTRRK